MPFWRRKPPSKPPLPTTPSQNPSPDQLSKAAAMSPSIPHLQAPPGRPNEPYVLPCYTGELWTIPTSNSTMRLLVSGNETANAFAVVGTGGTFDKPIGFHYHREAHDVFLCLKGTINVWANDTARSLGPGDFASVPPNTVHQYQVAASHSEFVGLIIPGGWEEFFRFVGETFPSPSIPLSQSTPLFPVLDKRNPFEVLIPKLMAATEKFDMIPVREKAHFDPQPWDGTETTLPGHCTNGGYYLKDGEGPKAVFGGLVVRSLATRKETNDRFSIYELHASSQHSSKGLQKALRFEKVHHAIYTADGIFKFFINGNEVLATAGETTFVPAGTSWSVRAESVYARGYVFADGGGYGEVIASLGSKYEGLLVPSEATEGDVSKIESLESELGFTTG